MKYRLKVAAAVLISLGATHARATGIPVIDVANLFQAVQQVINDITQINNQIQQIRQLQTQIESINGMRNLGDVFNNPLINARLSAVSSTTRMVSFSPKRFELSIFSPLPRMH